MPKDKAKITAFMTHAVTKIAAAMGAPGNTEVGAGKIDLIFTDAYTGDVVVVSVQAAEAF
jgi:hypothetical protein